MIDNLVWATQRFVLDEIQMRKAASRSISGLFIIPFGINIFLNEVISIR